MLFGRSLIYKIKNNGPKMDPCGTPQTGPLSHKFFPLTWTTRNLVVKYHFTQSGVEVLNVITVLNVIKS